MAGEPLAPAAPHRVDPDGTVTQVADELWWFPNGSVLTDDGVLLAVETFGNRVTAIYACALGGADRRTPFACAAPDFHEEARKSARQGHRLAARVCVPGRRSVTTGRGGPAPSPVDIPPKSGRHFNK
ncbi:hypothetical protein [Solwaraspora sp. WMMD792]|uniref:hypothetical protein n=1 Tax=Solwaraspora sp. WMMD792 TaxID=3016099 RepID=UPI002415D696|nr:hypothetical protein [Solwaraspora sp. WMMD792]MDG4770094.1 hypothetical protein [Solwaraspora sp. WMMD792]